MTKKRCGVCDRRNFYKKVSIKDPFDESASYNLMLCLNCKTISTDPVPNDLDKYYKDNYDSYQKKKSFFSSVYGFSQHFNNHYKTGILEKINAKSVLDYGCGSGSFLRYTCERGYETSGYEPINKTNDERISRSMKSYKNKKFDCITLWHVLEHTKNPVVVMNKLKEKLKKNGTMLVALPNYSSYDNIYYNDMWAGYDVPRHLYHFNTESFVFLSQKVGLRLIEKKPLLLDAFYVSILSEKKKKSVFPVIRGLTVGFLSNILSLFKGNPSSIIYILKK